MKNKYTNEITKFFDNHYGLKHYMCYDKADMVDRELPIICGNSTVGYVALNRRNIIFSVSVNTTRTIYSDEFEKSVSDRFMDMEYKFHEDLQVM